jgi:hypothetical protein
MRRNITGWVIMLSKRRTVLFPSPSGKSPPTKKILYFLLPHRGSQISREALFRNSELNNQSFMGKVDHIQVTEFISL